MPAKKHFNTVCAVEGCTNGMITRNLAAYLLILLGSMFLVGWVVMVMGDEIGRMYGR